MTTTLTDPIKATDAAEWCKYNKINYQLEYWGWPGSTKYRFVFDNENDLVLFSLKWT